MSRRKYIQQRHERVQKSALNLTELQYQNEHGDHIGNSLPHLCSAAFAFRQTESALHLHTLAFIPVILSLVSSLVLPGASQIRTGELDSMIHPYNSWDSPDSCRSCLPECGLNSVLRVPKTILPAPANCRPRCKRQRSKIPTESIHLQILISSFATTSFPAFPCAFERPKGWHTLTIRSDTLWVWCTCTSATHKCFERYPTGRSGARSVPFSSTACCRWHRDHDGDKTVVSPRASRGIFAVCLQHLAYFQVILPDTLTVVTRLFSSAGSWRIPEVSPCFLLCP